MLRESDYTQVHEAY